MENWLEDVAPQLGLADWSITVDWSIDGWDVSKYDSDGIPEAIASNSNAPDSKNAVIRISDYFLKLSVEEQTHTLVHELMHCYLFNLQNFAVNGFTLAAKEQPLAQELFYAGLNQQVEIVVDALADIYWQNVPLLDLEM